MLTATLFCSLKQTEITTLCNMADEVLALFWPEIHVDISDVGVNHIQSSGFLSCDFNLGSPTKTSWPLAFQIPWKT